MRKRWHQWVEEHPHAYWFYPLGIGVTVLIFLLLRSDGDSYGWAYAATAVMLLFAVRPGSALHRPTVERLGVCKTVCTVLAALCTIVACTKPMDKLPLWNGEEPGHRNQYELMAESILDGHIDLHYDEEDTLAGLENPYDPDQRAQAGVSYHWDHAYYEGHYYMYFGVAPVFLAFLPYRIVTGNALPTYQATQFFVAVFIVGIFMLFHLLSKRFFKKMPFSVYLSLSVAVSAMSVWYAAAEPALYCTAITAAMALQTWSLYFFVRAVYAVTRENRQILLAAIGALLGALVFACRPTIALANVLVIPLLIVFLRQRRFSWGLLGKLTLAALPYLLVGAALMLYNYARFENPFEFGQAYQLTVADQTAYAVKLNKESLMRIANGYLQVFFYVGSWQERFPYINTSGVFWNFPILLLCATAFRAASLREMRRQKALCFVLGLFVTVALIVAMDILWTPYWLERYNMDIYFLMGVACFMAVGFWYTTAGQRRRKHLRSAVVVLAGVTVVSAFLLCVYTIGGYYPEKINEIAQSLNVIQDELG